jgi:predicted secreted protein
MSADVPESLRLTVGSSHDIVLPGLGTAGYLWTSEVEGDENVLTLTWRRGFGESEHPAVGVSAPERLTISASAPGQAAVHLAQARSWETGKPPRAEHTVQVFVEG